MVIKNKNQDTDFDIEIDIENKDNELRIINKKDIKTPILSLVVIGILCLGAYSFYVTKDLSDTKSSLTELAINTKSLKNDYEKIDLTKYQTKEDNASKQKELNDSVAINNTELKSLQDKQNKDIKELRTYIDSKFDSISDLLKQQNEALKYKAETKQVPTTKETKKTIAIAKEDNDTDEELTNTYICFEMDKDYCKSFAIENKAEYYKMGNITYKTMEKDLYECDMQIHDKSSCNYKAYQNQKTKFKIGNEIYRVVDFEKYRLLKRL